MQKAIDSASVGEVACFRTLDELESGLSVPGSGDHGGVALIVRRAEGGRRETPERVVVTPEDGVPGDAWVRHPARTVDGQIAVMQLDVAELIANGQPLTLFGDNLFLDIDLSVGNLSVGSRLRVGGAVLEVTPKPHNGCRKFRTRFGDGALRFVVKPETRHRNLRGIYLRVVEPGAIACGDAVEVLSRPQSQA
jgi:MOSC domain-containing protein YiiM